MIKRSYPIKFYHLLMRICKLLVGVCHFCPDHFSNFRPRKNKMSTNNDQEEDEKD